MDALFQFLANATDGVFAVDSDQRIVLWNRVATEILGHRPEEALGQKCHQVIAGRDEEGNPVCHVDCPAIEAAREMVLARTRDAIVRAKDGREVWINVSTLLVPSQWSRLSALVHLFRDVSSEKKLAQAAGSFARCLTEIAHASPPVAQVGPLPPNSKVDLTAREREIVALLATGRSSEAISDMLSISRRTVGNHIQNIFSKLGVHSRLEAVVFAQRNGLV